MRKKSKIPGGSDKNYEKDKGEFLQKLKEFLQAKGTNLERVPSFGGQTLDLYALYNTVTSFGGISVVTDRKKWGQVFTTLGFPPCTNAAFALRQHYTRYLESYEKIFFLAEDDDTTETLSLMRTNAQMLKYRRLNKAPKRGTLGEPLIHNFNRISYSLQSGLQNEVNFALNICSLLSNVTNSIFNLAKSSNILDLILAHVGVWSKGDEIAPALYKEWYRDNLKDGCTVFWLDSLTKGDAKEMYQEILAGVGISCDTYMDEKDTKLLRAKEERDFSCDSHFSRVNQVTLILYNFSFEQINAMYIALHDGALRFLLLASSCRHNSICRGGLETMDNIAEHVTLRGVENTYVQQLMKLLHQWIISNDKFKRGRVMSIVGKLASKDENSKTLAEALGTDCYQKLIETLYLPDISLILSSMDALYTLSGLCETTATAIASIHGSISVLVCLVTIRAESYGNDAIKGYRIIENKNSIFTRKNQNWLKAQEAQRRALETQQAQGYPPRHTMNWNHSGYPRFPGPRMSPYPPHHPVGHQHPYPQMNQSLHSKSGLVEPPLSHLPSHTQIPPPNRTHPLQRLPLRNVPGHPAIPQAPVPPQVYSHPVPHNQPQTSNPSSLEQPSHEVIPTPVNQEPVISQVAPDPQTQTSNQSQQEPPEKTTSKQPTAPIRPIPTLPVRAQHIRQSFTPQIQLTSPGTELVELDPEIFTAHWISAYYEPAPDSQVLLEAVYKNYLRICQEMAREKILNFEEFKILLWSVLPSNITKMVTSLTEENLAIVGIKLRENPVKIQNKIPKVVHEQLLKNKPNFSNKIHKEKSQKLEPAKDVSSMKNQLEEKTSNKDAKPVPSNSTSFDPTNISHYQHILLNKNLESRVDCLEVIEKIKHESQMHFMQFHTHRQFIQQVQVQLQQAMGQYQNPDQLPTNMMNDIQAKVQNHHNQMQFHYGKLQSLSLLSEHVQQKLKQMSGDSQNFGSQASQFGLKAGHGGMNSPISSGSVHPPNTFSGVELGQPMMGPSLMPASPSSQSAGFNTPLRPRSGRGSRGGRMPRPKGASPRRGGSHGRSPKLRGSKGMENARVMAGVSFNPTGPNSLFNHCENSPFVTGGGSIQNHSLAMQAKQHQPYQGPRHTLQNSQFPVSSQPQSFHRFASPSHSMTSLIPKTSQHDQDIKNSSTKEVKHTETSNVGKGILNVGNPGQSDPSTEKTTENSSTLTFKDLNLKKTNIPGDPTEVDSLADGMNAIIRNEPGTSVSHTVKHSDIELSSLDEKIAPVNSIESATVSEISNGTVTSLQRTNDTLQVKEYIVNSSASSVKEIHENTNNYKHDKNSVHSDPTMKPQKSEPLKNEKEIMETELSLENRRHTTSNINENKERLKKEDSSKSNESLCRTKSPSILTNGLVDYSAREIEGTGNALDTEMINTVSNTESLQTDSITRVNGKCTVSEIQKCQEQPYSVKSTEETSKSSMHTHVSHLNGYFDSRASAINRDCSKGISNGNSEVQDEPINKKIKLDTTNGNSNVEHRLAIPNNIVKDKPSSTTTSHTLTPSNNNIHLNRANCKPALVDDQTNKNISDTNAILLNVSSNTKESSTTDKTNYSTTCVTNIISVNTVSSVIENFHVSDDKAASGNICHDERPLSPVDFGNIPSNTNKDTVKEREVNSEEKTELIETRSDPEEKTLVLGDACNESSTKTILDYTIPEEKPCSTIPNGNLDQNESTISSVDLTFLSTDSRSSERVRDDESIKNLNLDANTIQKAEKINEVIDTQNKDNYIFKDADTVSEGEAAKHSVPENSEKMEIDFLKEPSDNSSKGVDDDLFQIDKETQQKMLSKVNGLRLELLKSNHELVKPLNSNNQKSEAKEKTTENAKVEATKVLKDVVDGSSKDNTMQVFYCRWLSCNLPHFKQASSLLTHMIQTHAPLDGKMSTCQVEGCKLGPKMRGALISHFQTEHCTYINRKGIKSVVQITDKLLQKRDISPIPHEEESPVTRSVRFTAALILRNIAVNSPYGKSLIKMHEEKLALVAISKSEAASAISDCLAELLKPEETDTEPLLDVPEETSESICPEDTRACDSDSMEIEPFYESSIGSVE